MLLILCEKFFSPDLKKLLLGGREMSREATPGMVTRVIYILFKIIFLYIYILAEKVFFYQSILTIRVTDPG